MVVGRFKVVWLSVQYSKECKGGRFRRVVNRSEESGILLGFLEFPSLWICAWLLLISVWYACL